MWGKVYASDYYKVRLPNRHDFLSLGVAVTSKRINRRVPSVNFDEWVNGFTGGFLVYRDPLLVFRSVVSNRRLRNVASGSRFLLRLYRASGDTSRQWTFPSKVKVTSLFLTQDLPYDGPSRVAGDHLMGGDRDPPRPRSSDCQEDAARTSDPRHAGEGRLADSRVTGVPGARTTS